MECAGHRCGLLDGGEQQARIERLRQIAVHPGRQTALAIAGHRVRGHRDDAHVPAGPPFFPANRRRRLEAVHLRHLHVHQDEIEGLPLQSLQDRSSGRRNGDCMAAAGEPFDRHLLVDDVVFRKQHVHTPDGRRRHARRNGNRPRAAGAVAAGNTAQMASSSSTELIGLVR